MSDTPAPPQTDYPYAAQAPRDPAAADTRHEPATWKLWLEWLDIFPDWRPPSEGPFPPERVTAFHRSVCLAAGGACLFLLFAANNVAPIVIDKWGPPSSEWMVISSLARFSESSLRSSSFFLARSSGSAATS